MTPLFLSLPILLSATAPSEMTAESAFPGPETTYSISSLNGESYDKRGTLTFPEDGRIAGEAPCNNFNGSIDGTPAAFTLGPMVSTRKACPDMEAETEFLKLLNGMTSAEISDGQIILRDGQGNSMTFVQDGA